MPLEKPTPLTVQATSEKTFPHEWIYNFSVHAPAINLGRASFELLPYNSDTQEIGEGKYMEAITVDDLFACIDEVPEAAQAFGAILAAIAPVREWVSAQKTKENGQTQEP